MKRFAEGQYHYKSRIGYEQEQVADKLKCLQNALSGGGFHLLLWDFWGRYEVPDLP
jgi:hypothetical protein